MKDLVLGVILGFVIGAYAAGQSDIKAAKMGQIVIGQRLFKLVEVTP